MERINIGELLKNCPTGMELDCTICDNVYFDEVTPHMIKCFIKNDVYNTIYFHHDGTYLTSQNAKCVIFPKGKTTWEGFVPPCKFKDGDILATDLGSVFYLNTRLNTDERYGCYVGICGDSSFHICAPFAYKECCGHATEEEKERLFKAIKDKSYKWNAETKTLEKLIEPKFKVGDRIKCRSGELVYRVVHITEDSYVLDNLCSIPISIEHMYNLVPNKFDITTFKPFDKVLVRDSKDDYWNIGFFSFQGDKHFCTARGYYAQCIPYEENKHLLGTTNDCDDYYKTWE